MKKQAASPARDPDPRLHTVNQYLEKNFPDFFAEARFHVGNDDYFLYARFGKYLASSIEHRRFKSDKISRGFTVLNKLARKAANDPKVRHILVSGTLEEIIDEPKAREMALKRLSPAAQSYLEGLCE
jgi:hypothetical protein